MSRQCLGNERGSGGTGTFGDRAGVMRSIMRHGTDRGAPAGGGSSAARRRHGLRAAAARRRRAAGIDRPAQGLVGDRQPWPPATWSGRCIRTTCGSVPTSSPATTSGPVPAAWRRSTRATTGGPVPRRRPARSGRRCRTSPHSPGASATRAIRPLPWESSTYTPQRDRIGFDEAIINEEGRHQFGMSADDWEHELVERGFGGSEHAGGLCSNDYNTRAWHLPERLHPTNWAVREMCRAIHRRDPLNARCRGERRRRGQSCRRKL